MAVVEKTVRVSQEADKLATGIVSLVAEVKKALADGWQPGADLPVVLQAVLVDLVPAVQSVSALGAEAKADLEAFASAFALGGVKLVAVLAQ